MMLILFPQVADTLGVMDTITTVSRSVTGATENRVGDGRVKVVSENVIFEVVRVEQEMKDLLGVENIVPHTYQHKQ